MRAVNRNKGVRVEVENEKGENTCNYADPDVRILVRWFFFFVFLFACVSRKVEKVRSGQRDA